MSTVRRAMPTVSERQRSGELIVDEAYIHLTAAKHTTKSLARALGLSTATAFRIIKALRRRGISIESVKKGRDWYFAVEDEESVAQAWQRDRFLSLVGFVRGRKRKRRETVDDAVYRRE